jgi:hypothetical protein
MADLRRVSPSRLPNGMNASKRKFPAVSFNQRIQSILNAQVPGSTVLTWRRLRLLTQQVMLLAALGLFTAALFEPAVVYDPWGNGHQGMESGLTCLVAGVVYYPSNALLILSPIIALFFSRARRPYAQIFLIAIAIASTIWVAQVPFSREFARTRIGCDHWVEAHILMTFALLIPVWRGGRAAPKAVKTTAPPPSGFPVIIQPDAELEPSLRPTHNKARNSSSEIPA